jgi:hypothetical protein
VPGNLGDQPPDGLCQQMISQNVDVIVISGSDLNSEHRQHDDLPVLISSSPTVRNGAS